MNLSAIKQSVAHFESTLGENPVLAVVISVAVALAALILGGLLLDVLLLKKRARDKAKAVERLRKHLDGLPSSKS